MRLLRGSFVAVQIAFLSVLSWAPGQQAGAQTRRASRAASAADVPEAQALEAKLDEILARPDFKRAMRGGGHDPRNAGQWLLLRLRRLLARLGGLHATNYALFIVAVTVGLVLLIAILAHITYTFLQAFKPMQERRAQDTAAGPAPPLGPSALIREADESAARGDHRSAIRSLYLALIRSLQMRGVLPRAASQTNWEHLAHIAVRPALAAVVEPFTRTFDEKWYGGRSADSSDVARCRAWFHQAIQEADAE